MAGEETQWSKADRAAAALQAYTEAVNGPGSSYGDEGSEDWGGAVNGLLVDLKHLLHRVDYRMMLTDMAEQAVDVWSDESDSLPVGDEDDGAP